MKATERVLKYLERFEPINLVLDILDYAKLNFVIGREGFPDLTPAEFVAFYRRQA